MIPSIAYESRGELVVAKDEYWGTYIGEIERVYTASCWMAEVRIKACLEYPSQSAILYPDQKLERLPYDKNTLHSFPVENLSFHQGGAQEYQESVKDSLERRIDAILAKETGHETELNLLYMHLTDLDKKECMNVLSEP